MSVIRIGRELNVPKRGKVYIKKRKRATSALLRLLLPDVDVTAFRIGTLKRSPPVHTSRFAIYQPAPQLKLALTSTS
jgi:hypothetical protein